MKHRAVEVTILVVFITCLGLIWFLSFKYFAGLKYASPAEQSLLKVVTIVFYLCLLYFAYRFLEWVVRMSGRLIAGLRKWKAE